MTIAVSNVVVVGYGLIGPRHAHAVNNCPSTNLVGIVESYLTEEKRQAALAEFPGVKFFSSVEECLESGVKIEGAVVCTPNHTHYAISKLLLQNNVNVLVEKPISPNVEEARELKRVALRHGVKLLVGHHRRFNPYVMATKRHLHKCGQIVAVDAVWCLKKCEEYFEQAPWRRSKEQGGGVLNINLVHDLDLLQYFLGPLSEVYASPVEKTRDPSEDSVEEGAVILMTFANGTRGTFIVCDNVVSPANFEMGTGENPLIPQIEDSTDGVFYRFFGTQGSLSVPDLRLFHQKDLKQPSWWEKICKEHLDEDLSSIPFALQMEHFGNVIQGEEEPTCTADDGVMAMNAVNAVIESLDTQKPVKVLNA
ncbi:QTH1 [Cyberlindnera jadinii]|uniref:NAD(P)-binding protein n=1 Tax=Cyberlindnera jadinii (strain ATCC 18201 / CBS 1600 / BCRC 20928 / JCM 3617 / NBRC 0987 / NRRL Y-1542) TaxID=983966 RepID=A0A0H5BYW6_CYBJN|nr:NAD(P)-binding protein [Cyberlindnera jadinii NRRL Y-1542]ODV75868.1 NAD(P)-binding protein [Cyberlindnera jadinii NRRL Y-1542]CEP20571.1 QTH1 [Cyberlindnera jadinii]